MNLTIFSAHAFEQEFLLKASNQLHQLKFVDQKLSLETADEAAGSEAVALFTSDDASAPVLEKLQKLGVKYLALRSAGYDHVDLKKAAELGMMAANVPAYSPYAIGEHAVALIMALNRKLILAHEQVQANNFCLDNLIGFDVHGKTVGIVGLGKIGAVVAKIMNGFGCRILVNDVAEPVELGFPAEYVSLDMLLRESDIITLHAPLNEATCYLINAEALAKTKKGVMLINTSRGGLVNTSDLIAALKSGQVGAAGLDVYEHEKKLFFQDLSAQPLTDEVFAELKTFQNVLITGHQAFLTQTALGNISDTTLYNINCFAKGQESKHQLAAH